MRPPPPLLFFLFLFTCSSQIGRNTAEKQGLGTFVCSEPFINAEQWRTKTKCNTIVMRSMTGFNQGYIFIETNNSTPSWSDKHGWDQECVRRRRSGSACQVAWDMCRRKPVGTGRGMPRLEPEEEQGGVEWMRRERTWSYLLRGNWARQRQMIGCGRPVGKRS